MSAVLQPEPAVNQLPLLNSLAPEPELLEVAVWGRVSRQAQVRISTDGSVHLIVEILQPKGRPAFVAIRHAPAHQRADLQQLADDLVPGTAAVIRCRGIEIHHHEGKVVLKPVICTDICVARFSPIHQEH